MAAQPTGIIPTPDDLLLYDWACDPTEQEAGASSSLWLTILLFQFPWTSGYRHGPAKSPIAGNTGHIDEGVYKVMTRHDQAYLPLLFIEWARAAPDTPYGRSNAEIKILAVSNEFLTAHPERPHIYAIVCAGGRARIWKVEQDGRSLAALSPAWDAVEGEAYADAKLDSMGLLKDAFEEIRQSRL